MGYRRWVPWVLTVFLLSAAPVWGEDGKVDLRLRWTSGQIYVQRIETVSNIVQEFPGKHYEASESIRYEIVHEVTKVEPDGNAIVRCTCRFIHFKRTDPRQTLEFDSSDRQSPVPPEATGYALLAGTTMNIKFSPKGEILDISGIDDLRSDMLQRYAAAEGPARESVKRVFSRGNIREMLDKTGGIYPKSPVGLGDIWAETDVFRRFFPITVNCYYKLQERNGGKSLITIKGTIRSDPGAEPIKAGPMQLRYDLTGQLDGTVRIDESTGLTFRAEMNEKLSGNVLADGVPGPNPHMTWPISIDSTVSVEDITP